MSNEENQINAPLPSTEDLAEVGKFKLPDVIKTARVMAEASKSVAVNSESESDINLAQSNFKDLITKGNDTLVSLMAMAKSTDHPRAYEVLTQLLVAISQINKDLIESHKQKAEITAIKEGGQSSMFPQAGGAQSVTNQLFVGSTAELSKLISKLQSPIEKVEEKKI